MPKAFVIMPFADEFQDIWQSLIKPALEGAGFDAIRADSLDSQQNIICDIVTGIESADLVVADLTTQNTNVMYELGIAHTFEKPVILITQDIEHIPFDLRSYRHIHYSTRFNAAQRLSKKLEKLAREHSEGQIVFGNPVTDFRQGTGSNSALVRKLGPNATGLAIRRANHGKEIAEGERGWLDSLIESDSALNAFGGLLNGQSRLIDDMTAKMVNRTNELKTVAERGGTGVALAQYNISRDLAADMIAFARELSDVARQMQLEWERYERGSQIALSGVPIRDEADRQAAKKLLSEARSALENIGVLLHAIRSAREGIHGMKGLTRELNVAVSETVKAMDSQIVVVATSESGIGRTIALIEKRLSE